MFRDLLKSEKAYKPADLAIKTLGLQELVSHFRTMSRAPVDRKEDVELFCPSVFNPELEGNGFRTENKFVAASFLVLDFDDGAVSPEDLIATVRDEGQDL